MEERKIIQVTRCERSWVDIHVILRMAQLASGQTLIPHSLYEAHLVQRISTSIELHRNQSVRPDQMSTRMQSARMSPRDWNCSFSATPRAPRNPPSEMATDVRHVTNTVHCRILRFAWYMLGSNPKGWVFRSTQGPAVSLAHRLMMTDQA